MSIDSYNEIKIVIEELLCAKDQAAYLKKSVSNRMIAFMMTHKISRLKEEQYAPGLIKRISLRS
jgi:hypothetical protein